jgi:hypothetical protein
MSTPQQVTMRHPDLGEMQVMPISVPSWRTRGWEVAEDEPAPPPAPKEPDGQKSKPAGGSRRRHSEESE